MKDWFFYQDRGKTKGPFTLDNLKERIRSGRLRLFDLVYREGDPLWKIAMEYPELRAEFKKNSDGISDRVWVCLQKKKEAPAEFITSGPFSVREIKDAIQTGHLSYSDYAWRHGFSEWKRIGSLQEFNSKVKKDEGLPPIPVDSPEELLKEVVVMRRPQPSSRQLAESVPVEATTPELSHVIFNKEPSKPVVSKYISEKKVRQPSQVHPRRQKARSSRRSSSRQERVSWLDWSIVFMLMFVLGLSAVWISQRKADQVTASELGVQESQPEVKISSSEGEEILAKEQVEDVKPLSRLPTQLFLAVQDLGKGEARIDLRTDASSDYPVSVQVVGLPGQVAGKASFYRYLRVKPSGDPQIPLDLSQLKLPQGRFRIRAQVGSLQRERSVSLGVNEAAFKKNLARVRKLYAYAIWRERLKLLRFARLLDEKIKESSGAKKFNESGLEAIKAVTVWSGVNYVLFEEWWELKELYDAALKGEGARVAERTRALRERMADYSVWNYK